MTGIAAEMIQTSTAPAAWVIILPLLLALIGAASLLIVPRRRLFQASIAMVIVGAIVACDLALLLQVLGSGPVSMTMGGWLPPFGISFSVDIFGAGFALIAAGLTFLLLVYAQAESAVDTDGDGFYPLVLLLLAGVTGSFLTGDLFNLYVWFEVMLIASFGLIINGGRAIQLDGALKYGFLSFLATAFFLLALGLLYGLVGTLNMADIIRVAPAANPAAMSGIATLLFLAFGMKAAAFPVNAWLPASYHTPPTVVSALLAGLLTKVGVFALLRTLVVLLPASRDILEPALMVVATLTLIVAPLGAIVETNLRRAVGFLVIGGVGAIIAGIAVPSPNGVAGAGFYIVHAMLTMTALYLAAGLVEKVTGQVDSRMMGGVYAANSPLAAMFLILVLAVAGVPPLLGFWPKLLLLQASLQSANLGQAGDGTINFFGLALVVALLGNALLTLIAGTRLWSHVFWRAGPEGATSEHTVGHLLVLTRRERWLGLWPTATLVAIIVALGIFPDGLFNVVREGAADLLDPARYIAAVGITGVVP